MTSGIFCERVLLIEGQSAACRFYQPEVDEEDFGCRFEIDWPAGRSGGKAIGVDPVQALLLAMQKAHLELLTARRDKGLEISWLETPNLGLPLPKPISDWAPHNQY